MGKQIQTKVVSSLQQLVEQWRKRAVAYGAHSAVERCADELAVILSAESGGLDYTRERDRADRAEAENAALREERDRLFAALKSMQTRTYPSSSGYFALGVLHAERSPEVSEQDRHVKVRRYDLKHPQQLTHPPGPQTDALCDLSSIADMLNQELREAHSALQIGGDPEGIKLGIRELIEATRDWSACRAASGPQENE